MSTDPEFLELFGQTKETAAEFGKKPLAHPKVKLAGDVLQKAVALWKKAVPVAMQRKLAAKAKTRK